MGNRVPKEPTELAAYIDRLLSGDEKHSEEEVLPPKLRGSLQGARKKLQALAIAEQLSKGQHAQDAQALREFISVVREIATRGRTAVFATYGYKDGTVEDFGLATRRKRSKAEEAAETKASRTRELADNAKLQRDKARLRLEQTQARLARRERDAEHARKALPPPVKPPSSEDAST